MVTVEEAASRLHPFLVRQIEQYPVLKSRVDRIVVRVSSGQLLWEVEGSFQSLGPDHKDFETLQNQIYAIHKAINAFLDRLELE